MARTMQDIAGALAAALEDISDDAANGETLRQILDLEDLDQVYELVKVVGEVVLQANDSVVDAVLDAFLIGLMISQKITRAEGMQL